MWTHLKYYRDSADPAGAPSGLANASSAALFTEPLINSSQLLPRWQQGAVAWVKPQEALAQVGAMTGLGLRLGLGLALALDPYPSLTLTLTLTL